MKDVKFIELREKFYEKLNKVLDKKALNAKDLALIAEAIKNIADSYHDEHFEKILEVATKGFAIPPSIVEEKETN